MRDLWARTVAWRPVGTGMVVALSSSCALLMWWRPFLEHDDWDMLLPDHHGFVSTHATRVLFEGRWLNYWWWNLGSQGLSPRAATILFALGWLLATAVFVRGLDLGWWSVPAVVALFGAPMMSDISGWPATMVAPVWAMAISLLAMWCTRRHLVPHLILTALGVVVVALGYPTFALVLLAFLLVLHHAASWKRLLGIGVLFVAAYLGGVLIAFAFNQLRFGYFGIEIQPWRKPTHLNGLASLGDHLSVMGNDWRSLLQVTALPMIVAAVALLASLAESRLRRRLALLGITLLGAAVLAAASTITDGVYTPFRAMGWVWAFLVVVVAWGLEGERKPVRIIATVALVLVAAWSACYWAFASVSHYDREGWLQRLQAQIAAQAHSAPTDQVVFVIRSQADYQTAWILGNALAKQNGITDSTECTSCGRIEHFAAVHHVTQEVFVVGRRTAVRFSPDFLRGALGGDPYPTWLIPLR